MNTTKITAAQAMTLRTIAANGGEMDGYAGQKGFRTASTGPLAAKGLLELLGTTRTPDGTAFLTYNRVKLTAAGEEWLAAN